MDITNLKKEYADSITALTRTGILTLLPQTQKPGVIGIDGKEYPVLIQEQLQDVFTLNEGIQNSLLCAVPGCSVGLIEPMNMMPQPEQGKDIAGRKQLEGYFYS